MRPGCLIIAVVVAGAIGVVLAATDGPAVHSHVDGPPPPVAHDDFGFVCTKCHTPEGKEVRGIGTVTPLPHEDLRVLDRCVMCHVYVEANGEFRPNAYVPFTPKPRAATKDPAGVPPVVPHRVLLRENCTACHTGEGAAGAPVTTHPERERCVQCHVPQAVEGTFGK